MKNKITLLYFAALLLSTHSSWAKRTIPVVNKLPKATLGVKVGGNFEQLSGGTWEQAYKPGVVFGIFGGINKNRWGLKADVLVNTSQYALKDSLVKGTFRAVSLSVPVLVEYKLVHRVWLQAGPQFNSILSMKTDNNDIKDPKQFFNTGAVNLVGGVEARLPVHLVAGARYILGLTDLQKQNTGLAKEEWKQRSIQVYVGFRFI